MPDPETFRIIPLCLFGIFFAIGVIWRPVFFPISYMTLWLTKLANYYPFITQFKVELLVAFGGLLFVFFKSGNRAGIYLSTKNNLVQKYLLILLGCMLLSYLFAWDRQFSWDVKIYDFTKVIILYLLISLSIETERDLSVFIWFFVLFYAYLAYEPVYGFITGTAGHEEMYGQTYISDSGLLSGHVALANNMNQMIPFALFLLLGSRNKYLKILSAAILILFLVCLIGSKSRGGVAGFLMLGGLVVYFSKKRMLYGIGAVVIGVIMFVSSGDMGDTLGRIDSTSAHGRFAGLTNGLEMILKGNIFGVGPGCYLLARSHYFSYYMESHNIYGQVMGDLGIPGSIAAFFLVRQIFINLIQSRKQVEKDGKNNSPLYFFCTAIIVSLATRLFVSMGSHGLYFYYYNVVAALSAAIGRMSNINDKQISDC